MPDTGTPYTLRYPASTDVANVPSDMSKLANDVETALNTKLTAATAASTYQKKVTVLPVGTALPTGASDGDLVFFV